MQKRAKKTMKVSGNVCRNINYYLPIPPLIKDRLTADTHCRVDVT